jgi:hypothetical protein
LHVEGVESLETEGTSLCTFSYLFGEALANQGWLKHYFSDRRLFGSLCSILIRRS